LKITAFKYIDFPPRQVTLGLYCKWVLKMSFCLNYNLRSVELLSLSEKKISTHEYNSL
jgi:hypothetical protein